MVNALWRYDMEYTIAILEIRKVITCQERSNWFLSWRSTILKRLNRKIKISAFSWMVFSLTKLSDYAIGFFVGALSSMKAVSWSKDVNLVILSSTINWYKECLYILVKSLLIVDKKFGTIRKRCSVLYWKLSYWS